MLSLLAVNGTGNTPPLGFVASQLWWVMPFIFLIAMAGVYLLMRAVPLLALAIVDVLYMTEISAATISSALWSGEPFGVREISDIALITVAAAAVQESVRGSGATLDCHPQAAVITNCKVRGDKHAFCLHMSTPE